MYRILLVVPVLLLLGCRTPPLQIEHPPVPTASTEPPRPVMECFRSTQAADLQVMLATHVDATDHFPLATVKVYNVSLDELILSYEPGSIVIHCGDFEQPGPPPNFVRRREILRSKQPIEFSLPSGSWMRSPSTSGQQDLLIPTELPPGKYAIWATFHVGGPSGPVVESPHEWYVVH